MKTQDNQSEAKMKESAQIKTEYQTPIFNEFGSIADLTAGGTTGGEDDGFAGTSGN